VLCTKVPKHTIKDWFISKCIDQAWAVRFDTCRQKHWQLHRLDHASTTFSPWLYNTSVVLLVICK
jgi:hypothetical protein